MRGSSVPSADSGRCHSDSPRCTKKGLLSKSMCGFSTSECSEGTSCPCFIWSSTLVRPEMPAALSACPMLLFTEPIAQNCSSSEYSRNAFVRPATSIGSPSDVPVPCAST
ncbi:hypothetical protein GCM10010219_25820 [Streptomyces netropsis]|nr:hypothetical protein GCM10010219_25820 [Streptomyces netropsis]